MKTLEDSANRIADLADILYGYALKDWEDYQALKQTASAALDSIQTTMAPAVEKLRGGISQYFPAGVRMLFNGAAPSGWQKITTYDDCALRLTSGDVTARTNGLAFSACFAASRGTTTTQISMGVNGSTLSVGQLAGHSHSVAETSNGSNAGTTGDGFCLGDKGRGYWDNFIGWRGSNEAHGHGCWNTAHGHSLYMNVSRLDVILCEKV